MLIMAFQTDNKPENSSFYFHKCFVFFKKRQNRIASYKIRNFHIVTNIKYSNEIFDAIKELSVNVLNGPFKSIATPCERRASVVDCELLYFPHSEHRCQLTKRLQILMSNLVHYCTSS